MKKKRLLYPVLLLLSPFALLALLFGPKYFDPTEAEIHALIPQRAATLSQAVAWLKSENRMCTPRPAAPSEGKQTGMALPETSENGAVPNSRKSAATVIFTDFEVSPRDVSDCWARNILQYYLYFDAEGKLIASRSESICFGF